MKISPESLLKELKQGDTADVRVFVVYGEESYYRDLIAAAIEKQIFQDAPEEEREMTVFEDLLNSKQLAEAVNSYPLFTGHALVVVKGEQLFSSMREDEEDEEDGNKVKKDRVKAELDALGAVLSDVPDFCTVLINVSKLSVTTVFSWQLDETARICECRSIYLRALPPWLKEQARRYGARFEEDAVDFITEYLAPLNKAPLLLLSKEIEKLAAYTSPRKLWTLADVENVFAALPDVAAFSLMNFMAQGRLVTFLRILSFEKRKGTYILPICGQILVKLRELVRYRELEQKGYPSSQIAAELGKKYGVSALGREAKNFTLPALKEALLAVAALNRDIRRGGRDFDLLEEIIIRLFSASKRR